MKRTGVFIISVLVVILFSSCEQFQAITYVNKTSITVKVYLGTVPLSYTGTPTRSWNQPGDIIEASVSKELLTQVPPTKDAGTLNKYAIVAVTETNEVVLSKVFTWDELHDMDWTVVIGVDSSENISSSYPKSLSTLPL
jgi:hypothetical protein